MASATRRALAAARATRFLLVARELGLDAAKLGDVTGLFGDALADEAEVTIDPRGTRVSLAAPWPHDDEARARIASMLGDRIRILEERGRTRPVIEIALDHTTFEMAATSHGHAPLSDDIARAAVDLPSSARDALPQLAVLLADPARRQCDGVRSTPSTLVLHFRRTDEAGALASLLEVATQLGVTASQRKLVDDIYPIVGRNRTTVLSLHAGEGGLAVETSWPDISWENIVRLTTGLYGKVTGARVGSLAGATGAPHAAALHLLLGTSEPPRALVSGRIVAMDSVQ